MDGINIDIEQAVEEGSHEYYALTDLVKETTEAFHREIPGSQVRVMIWLWIVSLWIGKCEATKCCKPFLTCLVWLLYFKRSIPLICIFSRSLGLVRCCLVTKMYRQAMLWLRLHCWSLRPAVCHVLRWAESDHGGLYCEGKCPALSNTKWYVVWLCGIKWQQISLLMQNYSLPPYELPVIFPSSLWPVFESEDPSKKASDGSAMVWLRLLMPQPFWGKMLFI